MKVLVPPIHYNDDLNLFTKLLGGCKLKVEIYILMVSVCLFTFMKRGQIGATAMIHQCFSKFRNNKGYGISSLSIISNAKDKIHCIN